MNRSELKSRAKESLKGKYWESIKLFLLYILVCFGIAIVIPVIGENFIKSELLNGILAFIPILIVYGLYGGFFSFFLKISRNEEVSCNELFKHKNLFWLSIGVTFLSVIFSYLWMLLFIIPGIIAALNYSMAYFVIADNPEIGVMEALSTSKRIMKGHRVQYIVLNLSFLGWYIISYFTFGILLLWVAPYIMVTTANFYNEIKDQG